MMIKRRLLGLCIFSILLGCNKPLTNHIKTDITGDPQRSIIPLGTGFRSFDESFLGGNPCVISQHGHRVFPGIKAMLKGGFSESKDISSNKVSWGGRAEGSMGIFKISGEISKSKTVIDNDLKTSLFTNFKAVAGTISIQQPELSLKAKSLRSQDPWKRYEECGDEFIYQIELGGKLTLGLEFAFKSREERKNFHVKISGSASVFGEEITKDLYTKDSTFNQDKVNASVRIIFEQEGGDQTQYLAAKGNIPHGCWAKTDEDVEGENIKSQKLTGYQECLDAYKSLIRGYAAYSFPSQISPLTNEIMNNINESGYIALNYFTLPYSRIAYYDFPKLISESPSFVSSFLRQLVKPFAKEYEKLLLDLYTLEAILENPSHGNYLETTEKEQLTLHYQEASTLNREINGFFQSCASDIPMAIINDYKNHKTTYPNTIPRCDIPIENNSSFPATQDVICRCQNAINQPYGESDSLLKYLQDFNTQLRS